MKTPREVLLGAHRAVEPRLDALRKEVAAQIVEPSAAAKARARTPSEAPWWEALPIFRRHLAGLAGAWVLIAVLRLSSGIAETAAQPPTKAVVVSRSVRFSLRENRRQILESDNEASFRAPDTGQKSSPSRHSQLPLNRA
ncbi:MAG TPA: hypothetical protein VHI52_23135 [Verrucomicrobiae bacterium]|nr:hypothetical protein [Verrucomicrobiae bacterium]